MLIFDERICSAVQDKAEFFLVLWCPVGVQNQALKRHHERIGSHFKTVTNKVQNIRIFKLSFTAGESDTLVWPWLDRRLSIDVTMQQSTLFRKPLTTTLPHGLL